MIGSLRGTLLERSPDAEVLVEVGGVGYRVSVTPRTLTAIGDPGGEVFLYIHDHVREDAHTLYGFLARDERSCFEALLGALIERSTSAGFSPKPRRTCRLSR